jgi:hypothetical protein
LDSSPIIPATFGLRWEGESVAQEEYVCRAKPSLAFSIPATKLFFRERLKERIAQDEPGRQKRAEPLLANRVNGLDLRDRGFVTA